MADQPQEATITTKTNVRLQLATFILIFATGVGGLVAWVRKDASTEYRISDLEKNQVKLMEHMAGDEAVDHSVFLRVDEHQMWVEMCRTKGYPKIPNTYDVWTVSRRGRTNE